MGNARKILRFRISIVPPCDCSDRIRLAIGERRYSKARLAKYLKSCQPQLSAFELPLPPVAEQQRIVLQDCNLHTILRLPRGTFTPYSQGVKANVIFFQLPDSKSVCAR